MARPVDTILAGSIWGNFGTKEGSTEMTGKSDQALVFALFVMAPKVKISENDPKMTPLAEMTPNGELGIDVNS